jgi:hypothetical protein
MAHNDLLDIAARFDRNARLSIIIIGMACLVSVIIASFFLLYMMIVKGDLITVLVTHFAAIAGIPVSAGGSFVVVALFETVRGRIRFHGFGLSFEGASGPIVMWVLCFLSIAGAIRLLWDA